MGIAFISNVVRFVLGEPVTSALDTPATPSRARIIVREMLPDDFPAVLSIERASFPTIPASDHLNANDLAYVLDCRPWKTLVAEMAGRVVGFSLSLSWNLTPRRLIIDDMAVLPEFRRRGVASRLIEEIEAREAGHDLQLRAVIREGNLPAQLFLRSNGWRAVAMMRFPWEQIGVTSDEKVIRFVKQTRNPKLQSLITNH